MSWAQRSPFFMTFTTHSNPSSPTLSPIHSLVATTSTRIWLIIWNQPKIPVPLHQLFESYVCSFCINLFWLLVFWFRNEKRLAAAGFFYALPSAPESIYPLYLYGNILYDQRNRPLTTITVKGLAAMRAP